jgi:7-cyano-7-deazaguanine synthase
MDSALCLHRYGAALALGLDYGQPHLIELFYAQRLAEFYGVPFVRHQIPEMPMVDDVVFAGRNAVLLSIGAAVAQERGLDAIVIGCNLSDATRFADCRPEFIRSMDGALFAAYGVHVVAPLLGLTKQQIQAEVEDARLPPTWTCYQPRGAAPCGECYACKGLL